MAGFPSTSRPVYPTDAMDARGETDSHEASLASETRKTSALLTQSLDVLRTALDHLRGAVVLKDDNSKTPSNDGVLGEVKYNHSAAQAIRDELENLVKIIGAR